MAQITLTIPNDQVQRVVDALATYGGYSPTPQVTDENGVETPTDAQLVAEKNEFARKQLIKFVKDIVLDIERRAAIEAAANSVTTPTVT